ncbi:hypothetical protein BOTNAR_0177g00050 [Botryotinia narcissicola]|uniref:Uncharacterized protein n=1 Tax=Botryotinia narcissicola TaxID=278944 RepID=A0A4Z1IPJ1_9HELO|nr:hypothetical protein BOTNAR_0177g00050 [Botryotinia narcissicola]
MTKQHAMMCIYAPTSPMSAASRYCRYAEYSMLNAQCSRLYAQFHTQSMLDEWMDERESGRFEIMLTWPGNYGGPFLFW